MSFYSKSHDLVVVGTNYSMYVVTSLGSVGIMRMVFVTILNPLILEYLKVFTTVAENRLGWVYGNDPINIPHMNTKHWDICLTSHIGAKFKVIEVCWMRMNRLMVDLANLTIDFWIQLSSFGIN